ncbi:hypothetical protein BDE02_13G127800 [Populus trichocarpa]|nr:hypothetical protein BDE02_13G127800 [Populus trichocarpa]
MSMEKGLISVDRFTESSQTYFLTHLHTDHTQGLTSKWGKGPLFCSKLTAKLLPFKFPDFNLSLLCVVDLHIWHSFSSFLRPPDLKSPLMSWLSTPTTALVVDIIAFHPEHDIVIGIDTLGKEELLIHISRVLKVKI